MRYRLHDVFGLAIIWFTKALHSEVMGIGIYADDTSFRGKLMMLFPIYHVDNPFGHHSHIRIHMSTQALDDTDRSSGYELSYYMH